MSGYRLGDLVTRRHLPALLGVAAIVAVAAGAFAYTAGWLGKGLTPSKVVDGFEQANGPHAGFRRNHSKGVCFTGSFESDASAQTLSKAALFRPGTKTPLFGRFALAGGQPMVVDTPQAVRSMALSFALADGETWRMGLNGIPVFTVTSVQDLYDQLRAATPDPQTGKPDPARMKAFMDSHPATAKAMALIKAQPPTQGFDDTPYNSLDAFLFTNERGETRPVRWAMIPQSPARAEPPSEEQLADHNYLFDDFARRVADAPLRWRMVATVGQAGDSTTDPTTAWPADRQQVELGTLTIDKVQDETQGPCRDVTFDPLILPAGVRGSDDPILSARSATYAQSFTRRSGEPAPTPAVGGKP